MSWKLVNTGKVRKIFEDSEGTRVALVATDGVSAFDQELGVTINGKGRMLTAISKYWFDKTEMMVPNAYSALKHADGLKNEPLDRGINEDNTTVMLKLNMLPIEAIVRGYLTGSIWAAYNSPESPMREYCGIRLPDGMKNCEAFEEPIFTPTTKAPKGEHDQNLSYEEMVKHLEDNGVLGARDRAQLVREYSLKLYNYAHAKLLKKGIILADTKFEFGINPLTGNIMLGDELLTPDSSRFWSSSEYEIGRDQRSLDKQVIRDFVKAHPGVRVPQDILEDTSFIYTKIGAIIMN